MKASDKAMTADQVLAGLSPTLQSEAVMGGEKITVGLLRKKMIMKAEHKRLFEIVEGGGFVLRKEALKPQC